MEVCSLCESGFVVTFSSLMEKRQTVTEGKEAVYIVCNPLGEKEEIVEDP